MELQVLNEPEKFEAKSVHELKMELFYLRKMVWPVREMAAILMKGGSPLVKRETQINFRDIYDHASHVIETAETLRENSTGVYDLYLSHITLRTNEIMRILTLIATIFIPLTFIAGIYGMNFKVMPELEWVWGYPVSLALMFVIAVLMLIYFRRRRWL